MKHIASCSFGKDSLATVILAREHGEPLDEVVYCEVMFDDQISGEVPEHRDFIYNVAIPKLKSWGIPVTVLRSQKTYMDEFFRVCGKRSSCAGKLVGFPLAGRCAVNGTCKMPPIRKYMRTVGECITYVGIASDERKRLERNAGTNKVSLLEKYNVSEAQAKEIAERAGLLSPIYKFAPRNGCWFCPNSRKSELWHILKEHPDLWNRLLELDAIPNKAGKLFDYEHRISEIDTAFHLEADQISLFDFLPMEGDEQ